MPTDPVPSSPAPVVRARQIPRGCLAAFFSLFTFLGLAFVLLGIVIPGVRIEQAEKWQPTPCTIVTSESVRSDGLGGGFEVAVRYRYEFDGVEHESHRYKLMETSGADRAVVQTVVDSFPPRTAATCFVNPEDPTEAVLMRGWSGEWILGLGGLVFALLGPLGYGLMLRAEQRRSRAEAP